MPLLRLKWIQMIGLISGSPILFHWSTCLYLCQYNAVLFLWFYSIVWYLTLFFFAQDCFGYLGILCFYINLELTIFVILRGLYWICGLLLIVWPFWLYLICLSMKIGSFSTFYCLWQFLSSVIYSFHCRVS
jgi:hypothetical protein